MALTGNACESFAILGRRHADMADECTPQRVDIGKPAMNRDLFRRFVFLTSNQLVQQTGLSAPTVNAALPDLEKMGLVEEVIGRKRGRVFSYQRYLAILSEGTDPLPAGS